MNIDLETASDEELLEWAKGRQDEHRAALRGASRVATTSDLPPEVKLPPTLSDWIAEGFELPPFTGKCSRCRAPVENPGACAACLAALEARERAVAIRKALRREIPERFAWARWDSPDFASRVWGGAPKVASARKAFAATDRVVLVGPGRRGKTSLACAHLAERIEAGADRARFVAARNLLDGSYLEGVSWYALALSARVLVLDDLGAELSGAPSGSGLAAQRIKVVSDLIAERHDRGLGHVVTTAVLATKPAPGEDPYRAGIAEAYGDGVAGRLFEGAAVVRLGGAT